MVHEKSLLDYIYFMANKNLVFIIMMHFSPDLMYV